MSPTLFQGQAILLDRDGVINRQAGQTKRYVTTWEEFEFLPGVLPALRTLATLQRPIIILTNQSPLGRGIMSVEQLIAIHQRMKTEIVAAGGRIDSIFFCPHHPNDGCTCRKPRPGLLHQAAEHFNLNLQHCCFVGDSWTDFQAAKAAGSHAIMVRSGQQGSQLPTLLRDEPNVPLVADLAAAVPIIRHFLEL